MANIIAYFFLREAGVGAGCQWQHLSAEGCLAAGETDQRENPTKWEEIVPEATPT